MFRNEKELYLIYLFIILISSILYFSIPVVWHTQSSYLGSILIYLSIFFSAGVLQIKHMLSIKNERIKF